MHTYGQGRYRVVGPLGSGAFAVVHEVEDTRLGVRRALKVLRPEVAGDPVARARFAAEARTMASLRHPHLVGVLDVGEDVGDEGEETGDTSRGVGDASRTTVSWLVMELLPGGTLAEAVQREGASDPVAAVRAMLGVIEGVGLAHRSGVVHRDIKPANLLVDADGGLKLGDFGVAQLRTMDDLTRTGVALGSWAFMAPEQRLDPRRVGPTSDVYGLAATLVWRIHGAPVSDLHVGEHRARLLARAPEGLAAVLSRALAFRAEERYRTADGFGEALREAIAEAEGEGSGAVAQPASGRQAGELGAGAVGPVPRRPQVAGSARPGASSRDAPATRSDTVAGAAHVPARGGPLRGWGLAGLARVVGVGAGGWPMTREGVRGRFVTEPDEVRRARELAAIPVCEDAPTRWELSNAPRDIESSPGKREAGGGRIADVDKDGHPDVVYAHQLDGGFRIFWGDASGRLPRAGQDVDAPRMNMGSVDGVDVADMNNDGLLDLLGTATESRGVIITLGTGPRAFGPSQVIESGAVPYGVRAADWDGDGTKDLVLRTMASDEPVLQWRRGLGNVKFDSTERLSVGGQAFEIADILPDEGLELLVAHADALHVYVRNEDARVGDLRARIVWPIDNVYIVRLIEEGAAKSIYAISSSFGASAFMLRVRIGSETDMCKVQVPGASLSDVGRINDDVSIDLSALQTCSYCTSSYQSYYGLQ